MKMPKEIGRRSRGSNCFTIARYMRTKEMISMTSCCHVIVAYPEPVRSP